MPEESADLASLNLEDPARAARTQSALLRVWHVQAPATLPQERREHLDGETRFMLLLGGALLGYGLPCHRVEESLLRLCKAFNRVGSVFCLPTFLSITLHHAHGHETHSVRAQPATIDLSRLDALYRIVAAVELGHLAASEAERRVHEALTAPRQFSRVPEILAVALVSGGGTLVLGGSSADASFAVLLGILLGLMLWLACARPAFGRVLPVSAAVLASLISTLCAKHLLIEHPLIVAISSLFVFVPGLSLTLAMTELATGHLVSGTARSMGALTVFLQLGLGLLLGSRLAGLAALVTTVPALPGLMTQLFGNAVLALGFAILFAVRRADTWSTLGISLIALVMCRFSGESLGPEIGALVGATCVGLASHAFARLKDRPSSTLSVPGVALLVPGSLGMLSISAAVIHDGQRALDLGFQMMMVMVALSTGALVAAAALPPRSSL